MNSESNPARIDYSPIKKFLLQIFSFKINKYIEPETHSYSYLFLILLTGIGTTFATISLTIFYFFYFENKSFLDPILGLITFLASISSLFLGSGISLLKLCWGIDRNLNEPFYLYELRAVLQLIFVITLSIIGLIVFYNILVFIFV